jgi:hypothetical protein
MVKCVVSLSLLRQTTHVLHQRFIRGRCDTFLPQRLIPAPGGLRGSALLSSPVQLRLLFTAGELLKARDVPILVQCQNDTQLGLGFSHRHTATAPIHTPAARPRRQRHVPRLCEAAGGRLRTSIPACCSQQAVGSNHGAEHRPRRPGSPAQRYRPPPDAAAAACHRAPEAGAGVRAPAGCTTRCGTERGLYGRSGIQQLPLPSCREPAGRDIALHLRIQAAAAHRPVRRVSRSGHATSAPVAARPPRSARARPPKLGSAGHAALPRLTRAAPNGSD